MPQRQLLRRCLLHDPSPPLAWFYDPVHKYVFPWDHYDVECNCNYEASHKVGWDASSPQRKVHDKQPKCLVEQLHKEERQHRQRIANAESGQDREGCEEAERHSCHLIPGRLAVNEFVADT